MPFAIEPTVKPTLDIPAPIVSAPQAGERNGAGAPSFQDHLDRAGRSNDTSSSTSSSSDASSTERNDRSDAEARRRDDAGDRAEADRRNEKTDAQNRTTDPNAPKTDDAKPKPADGEVKVEGKKDKGEHEKKDEGKPGDEAVVVGVVAAAAVQEATAKDEVTLTTDEAAAEAAKKEAGLATPADRESKGKELPIDPTAPKAAKDKNGDGATVKVVEKQNQTAAALAEAQAKDDASGKDGDATAAETPAVPIVSELHSTRTSNTDEKKPKTRAEFTAAVKTTTSTEATAGDAVADATAEKPATEPAAASTEQVATPEKAPAKSGDNAAQNTDPSFAAQLQGAVEAAAATTAPAATVAATDVTTVADATTTTATVTTTTTDAATKATTATTKSPDAPLTAAEALRSTASKETTSNRVAGEEARQSDGLSSADRARLVQRVARAIRTTQERGGELQIRLSPPELGQLRLQVQMTNGALSARIEAESPQAQQVITDNLNVLRERLAEQGVRVERIDVELMNTGNGGSPNTPDRRNDFSHDGPTPRGFGSSSRNSSSGDAAAVEASAASPTVASNGRLNVVI